MKEVTLVARTLVSYRGKQYGDNMQFVASMEDGERFVKSGQAELAPESMKKALAAAERAAVRTETK